MRNCAYPECERPAYAKGLCNPHYQQQRKGLLPVAISVEPLAAAPRSRDDPVPRLIYVVTDPLGRVVNVHVALEHDAPPALAEHVTTRLLDDPIDATTAHRYLMSLREHYLLATGVRSRATGRRFRDPVGLDPIGVKTRHAVLVDRLPPADPSLYAITVTPLRPEVERVAALEQLHEHSDRPVPRPERKKYTYQSTCSALGCSNRARARGLCSAHYALDLVQRKRAGPLRDA